MAENFLNSALAMDGYVIMQCGFPVLFALFSIFKVYFLITKIVFVCNINRLIQQF